MNMRTKVFDIHEFIEYAKENKNKFTNYLEIIITNSGDVLLANPSHTERMIEYVINKENITRDKLDELIPDHYAPLEFLLDKYKCVSVWYRYLIMPETVTGEQRYSIDELWNAGLLGKQVDFRITREYKTYLYHKQIGLCD